MATMAFGDSEEGNSSSEQVCRSQIDGGVGLCGPLLHQGLWRGALGHSLVRADTWSHATHLVEHKEPVPSAGRVRSPLQLRCIHFGLQYRDSAVAKQAEEDGNVSAPTVEG